MRSNFAPRVQSRRPSSHGEPYPAHRRPAGPRPKAAKHKKKEEIESK